MRVAIIGPTWPYRGGIAHYTTLLARHLRTEHDVLLISFKRQYPRWLYPGKSDRDPAPNRLQTEAEYLLDSVNPLTWWQTIRRIRQFKPDRLVMQWWVPFWLPQWAVISRAVGVPVTFIAHNALPHEAGRFDRWAVQGALGAAAHIIAQAQSDADILATLLSHKRISVTVHPTYAELGAQDETAAPIDTADTPLLLFCGMIRPYKGLDILLDALPMVLAQQAVHLAIVGEMWQGGAQQYQQQIARLGLGDHVTIEDAYVSDERLSAWIKAAAAVVLPYRTATQSGIVQLAFGLGKSVIATRVGGLPDVIVDGENGLLVPPEDAHALAAAINRYLNKNEGLQSVFEENIGRQQDRFSWQTLCDLITQTPL